MPGVPTIDEMEEQVVVKEPEGSRDRRDTEPLQGSEVKKRGPGRPKKVPTPSAAPIVEGEGRRLRSGRVIPDLFSQTDRRAT